MTLARIAVGHLRAAAVRESAYAVLVAVVAALVAGLGSYLAAGLTTGVRVGLDQAVGTDAVRVLTTRAAADDQAAGQRAAGTRVLQQRAGAYGAAVLPALRSDPQRVAVAGAPAGSSDAERSLVLATDPTPPARDPGLRLVDGAWPSAQGQAAARDDSGLRVGDVLRLGATSYDVVATWRPRDPAAARWAADPAYRPTLDPSGRDGLLIVDVAGLAAGTSRPLLRWTVTPRAGAAGPSADEAAPLAEGLRTAERLLDRDVAVSGLVAQGRLPQTLDRLDGVASAVRPMFPVAFVLVGVGCLLVLGESARLLAVARLPELTLLRARGTSLPQLAVLGGLGGLLVGLPAALLGALAGTSLSRLVPGADLTPLSASVPVATVAVVLVLAVGAPALALAATGSRALARTTGETTGRATSPWPRAAALVLLAVVAGASVLRLRTRSGQADPFLAIGPAATLLLLALLTLLTLGATTGGLARLLAGLDRGLPAVLAARQASRRLPLVAAPAVALTLAVAGTLLAAGYSASAAAAQSGALRGTVGPDVRLAPAGGVAVPPPSPAEVAALAPALGPGGRIAPVLTRSTRLGELDDVALVAAPPGAVPGVAVPTDGARGGVRLPAAEPGPDLVLDVVAALGAEAPAEGRLTLTAWLSGADGALQPVRSASAPLVPGESSAARVRLPWPADLGRDLRSGRATLAALDLVAEAPGSRGVPLRVVVRTARLGDAPVDLGRRWRTPDLADGVDDGARVVPGPGLTLRLDDTAGGRLRRLIPGPAAPPTLPTVISAPLADALALRPGDEVDGSVEAISTPVRVRLSAVRPVVPGAGGGPAALLDLGSLQRLALQTSSVVPAADERWLDLPGADADAVQRAADRVRRLSPPDLTVTTSSTAESARLIAPAGDALWAGAAGVGLLAAVAFALAGLAALGVRRRELPVLRGLGLDGVAQAAGRVVEQALLVVVAVATGVLAGAAAVGLLAVPLARTVVPDLPPSLTLRLRVDLDGALLVLAGTLVLVLLVALAHAAVVRRRADRADLRGSAT